MARPTSGSGFLLERPALLTCGISTPPPHHRRVTGHLMLAAPPAGNGTLSSTGWTSPATPPEREQPSGLARPKPQTDNGFSFRQAGL